VSWLIPATVVFYVVCAATALLAGEIYAIAAVGAGLIPLTAVTLITATARAKTVGDDAARRDATSAEHTDPFPGIGVDDTTPLGDTPEHSDAERVAKPDPRLERRLEVEVHVLERWVPAQLSRGHFPTQVLQAPDEEGHLGVVQQPGSSQAADMGDRSDQVVVGQLAVDLDRAREVGHACVGFAAEPPAPGPHRPSVVRCPSS
jgi:hypothetical protein